MNFWKEISYTCICKIKDIPFTIYYVVHVGSPTIFIRPLMRRTMHVMLYQCLSVSPSVIYMSDMNSPTLKPLCKKLLWIVYIYWSELTFVCYTCYNCFIFPLRVLFIQKGGIFQFSDSNLKMLYTNLQETVFI